MDRPDSPTTCTAPDGLTVLYDGACPLCRREIGVYQGLAPTQPLEFRDVLFKSCAASFRQRCPGTLPAVHRALSLFYVTSLFKMANVFRKDGITDIQLLT